MFALVDPVQPVLIPCDGIVLREWTDDDALDLATWERALGQGSGDPAYGLGQGT